MTCPPDTICIPIISIGYAVLYLVTAIAMVIGFVFLVLVAVLLTTGKDQ